MQKFLFLYFFVLSFFLSITAQNKKSEDLSKLLNKITFRNIGPAFMSGRISDIAIHPENPHIWYVAVGSGGVWKTENSGTEWKPIFDSQKSFSIGCITIDPNNPHTIWVGTGENVGGRHVSFGDGIYKSTDDGKTWKNMGLKKSEHISEIIIHPNDSNIIYVAVQGPLWSSGGERGFYKSTDGGKTWKKTLGNDEWIGVTDIDIDPRNPDRVYAATWERHRTIANYMGGGIKTAIYRSEDGGETWKKIMKGINSKKNGKIGIAVSPIKPDVIYAAVEHNRTKGSVYKSTNRGETWIKQSNTVSGATGPHYYQELYVNPHQFDQIFLANVRMLVSDDGGKNFYQMPAKHKHVDNHALVFRKDDPNYRLVGTDGGLYESFDKGKTWRFINNLPVTQFYKIAVDDSKPFYYIYGGTQDNSTERGPSRTDNLNGIANRDWEIVLFADGHQPATEPGNPNIVYAQWQQGNLVRVDIKTGEKTYIQPQPDANEDYERYNWDAPVLISPHSPTRLYFGSQRVWRSDNRGNDWTPISGDLTQYEERFDKPIMGKKQSWDSPWDVNAMSTFNTITSLSESPVQEGLIYVGTDDGLIQVTENGGKSWRKIKVNQLPGVPTYAYVNDIKADLFDANTVYVALDNHKEGDFAPYLYKSTDKGKTWKKITGNLSGNLLIWRLVQDYKNPKLMFIGTEFGIYVTLDGGKKWYKLNTVANISFRDLAIKKGEDDLVGGSFGRGIFILDDYSFLRHINDEVLEKEAFLFKPRDSWWYYEKNILGRGKKGSQGASYFTAPNPPYGTTFTYYLKDSYKTIKDERQEKENKKKDKDIDFPGWKFLDKEINELKPQVFINILSQDGKLIKRVEAENKKGFYRATWNHTEFSKDINQNNHFATGVRVPPGTYKAYMSVVNENDVEKVLTDTIDFNLKRLYQRSLPGTEMNKVVEFWKEVDEMQAKANLIKKEFEKQKENYQQLYKAYLKAHKTDNNLLENLLKTRESIIKLERRLFGSAAKKEVGEKERLTLFGRLAKLNMNTRMSSYGPTGTDLKVLKIIRNEYQKVKEQLVKNDHQLKEIEKQMKLLDIPLINVLEK